MKDRKIPTKFLEIINDSVSRKNDPVSITRCDSIPDSSEITILHETSWKRIDDIVCVYVDMINSTQLSSEATLGKMAKAYRYFTGTAVKLFDKFGAQYIDIKGDGVFAIFNPTQPFTAFASAVTFKTFCKDHFTPDINKEFESKGIKVGVHIGIDCEKILVKKIGVLKKGQENICNEVWAGKTVNMAAKLASEANDNELLVSDRFFNKINTSKLVTYSCNCKEKAELWTPKDVSQNSKFDFSTAYSLTTIWCENCGAQFCHDIMSLD